MDGSTYPSISNSLFRITTDVYAIPLDGRYLVYAPLRKLAFVANAELVNLLWQCREGKDKNLTVDQETILRFFQQIQLVGFEGDHPITTFESASFNPVRVTLFLTNRCNLRCTYCYASAGAYPPQDMPQTLAERGIDFILENASRLDKRMIGIAYHGGGEPTINWRVLVESLQYARNLGAKRGLKVHASMATNGVLSANKQRWIIENMDALSLSWDGLPEVQDAQRPRASGRGSSDSVLRTIENLETVGFHYGIRMTVTSLSVERLAESIAFLLERARPQRIQAEPVYSLGRGEDESHHVSPLAFIQAFREAKSIARQHGIEMIFSAARIESLTNRFCRSCGEGFSITPSGDVSACFEVPDRHATLSEPFIFGVYNIRSEQFVFDSERLVQLRDWTVEHLPWCNGCFARWHCAGDCQHKVRNAMEDGEFGGHPRCEITRAILLDQILEKIHESGGILWREGLANTSIPMELLTKPEVA